MTRHLRLTFALLPLTLFAASQHLTPATDGPFRVSGAQLIDAHGRPFVIRGTGLRPFHPQTEAADAESTAVSFGPHSATSLAAIRLRFNLNAVRLPLTVADAGQPDYFTQLAALVRRANAMELLVILSAPDSADSSFWSRCATEFRDYPNVLFEAPASADSAIRATGATQPIVGTGVDSPRVVVWDVNPNDASACPSIPTDPGVAAELVRARLDAYDRDNTSWIVSEFEVGRLIKDFYAHDATTFEDGWTCGQPFFKAGLGRLIQAHMRATDERGLFVIGTAGGLDIARGGYAIAYGPVLAAQDASSLALPFRLGGIRIDVTDARGATRPARIFYATAGWSQVNFVVPSESALGPARMTLWRSDGSSLSSNLTITETAPGFWTGISCRGPALGSARLAAAETPISTCKGQDCETLPVRPNATVRLIASGLRHAKSAAAIEATLDGVRVPVVSYGPAGQPGMDQLTIRIPRTIRPGEVDLLCRIDGRVSNPVRLRVQ